MKKFTLLLAGNQTMICQEKSTYDLLYETYDY